MINLFQKSFIDIGLHMIFNNQIMIRDLSIFNNLILHKVFNLSMVFKRLKTFRVLLLIVHKITLKHYIKIPVIKKLYMLFFFIQIKKNKLFNLVINN